MITKTTKTEQEVQPKNVRFSISMQKTPAIVFGTMPSLRFARPALRPSRALNFTYLIADCAAISHAHTTSAF